METLCSLRRRPILNAKERAQCCGRQDRRPDPRGVKCNACSASLLGPVEWPVPIEDAVASTIVAVELVHLAVLLDRSASQAKARSARPQKLKGELYQGVEANGEVDWGTQILDCSRSPGRLSARVLDDSPISASLPPNSLLILMKSRRRRPIQPVIGVNNH
jgi:hypothetical protein